MWRGAFFRHRPGGEIATALLAIERLATSNAMPVAMWFLLGAFVLGGGIALLLRFSRKE